MYVDRHSLALAKETIFCRNSIMYVDRHSLAIAC